MAHRSSATIDIIERAAEIDGLAIEGENRCETGLDVRKYCVTAALKMAE